MDLVKRGLSDYRTVKPQDWSLVNAFTDTEFFDRYDAGDIAMEVDTNGNKRVSGFARYVPPNERFRDLTAQREAGGESRRPTDQGGHLLADSMSGPSVELNLEAMDGKLNQGLYKRTELQLIEKLKQGDDVYVEIESHHNDASQRPDRFTYNWVSRDSDGTMDCGAQMFENEYPRLDFGSYPFEFDPEEVTDLIEDGIEMTLEEDLPEQADLPEQTECPEMQEFCSEDDAAVERIDGSTLEALAAEFDDME